MASKKTPFEKWCTENKYRFDRAFKFGNRRVHLTDDWGSEDTIEVEWLSGGGNQFDGHQFTSQRVNFRTQLTQ